MSATKTLSVRVPQAIFDDIENICKQRNITRNALLTEYIASREAYSNGGMVVNANLQKFESKVPEELSTLLSIGGGGTAGYVVYHILDKNLPETWDNEKRQIVSFVGAFAAGLLAMHGIQKLLSNK